MRSLKLYTFLTIVITLWSQQACSSGDVPVETPLQADPVVIATAVSEAETLFRQRQDVAKLKDAVAGLAKARSVNPRTFEIEWRYAKFSYFLGKKTADKKEATAIFRSGSDAGEIASVLEPERADGYFWYGANLGEVARMDMFSAATSIKKVQQAMTKVLEIKPEYQKASAYDALAEVELETRFIGGSAEKAVHLLQKALEVEKNNVNLHLHLAQALLALKKEDEARRHLDTLLKMKPDPDYVVEYDDCVVAAKKLLESRFGA